MRVVDLTYPISEDMVVYPGEPKPMIKNVNTVKKHGWCEHSISLQTHIGTHIDAPMHMLTKGKSIDKFKPEHFFGRAIVVDCKEKEITSEPFKKAPIKRGDIVLIRTGEMKRIMRRGISLDRQPHLTLDAAKYLAAKGAKMIGIDSTSPGDSKYNFETHKYLLSRNILIIEFLVNLDKLPQQCHIYAFPLLINGVDGAQARVIAIIR
ncbi:MAG: cyclase family protein [Candidatus Diapherotrites archaeon]|nr:cyclase family protein [Candidatus Diapherotrites archaeon]